MVVPAPQDGLRLFADVLWTNYEYDGNEDGPEGLDHSSSSVVCLAAGEASRHVVCCVGQTSVADITVARIYTAFDVSSSLYRIKYVTANYIASPPALSIVSDTGYIKHIHYTGYSVQGPVLQLAYIATH